MKRIHKLLLGALCVISPVILAACYGPMYYPNDTPQPDAKPDTKAAPAPDVTAQDLLVPDNAEEATPQE
jgi:hypothetical protein